MEVPAAQARFTLDGARICGAQTPAMLGIGWSRDDGAPERAAGVLRELSRSVDGTQIDFDIAPAGDEGPAPPPGGVEGRAAEAAASERQRGGGGRPPRVVVSVVPTPPPGKLDYCRWGCGLSLIHI